MSMTLAEIRLKQNPILTNLLLGIKQGNMIAERLLPRLPSALSGMTLVKMGDEAQRRYNLRRAPGAKTKRINLSFEGKSYTVDQYSVDIPIPRELIREADESRKLNVGNYLQISALAMSTANGVLALDYELEVAELTTNGSTYASGHHLALSGGTKWSAVTGTPVTDIKAAADIIRKKIGVRPNRLALSADAMSALESNAEVKTYLPSTQQGMATLDQLKQILNVQEILVGDAVYKDASGNGLDVWGNNAILGYVPNIGGSAMTPTINMAEPALGFTSVIEGHPFAETPYYSNEEKSWIYGATFERRANVSYAEAGFLFSNVK